MCSTSPVHGRSHEGRHDAWTTLRARESFLDRVRVGIAPRRVSSHLATGPAGGPEVDLLYRDQASRVAAR